MSLRPTTRISTSVMIQQMTIHTMYWVTPPKTTVGSEGCLKMRHFFREH